MSPAPFIPRRSQVEFLRDRGTGRARKASCKSHPEAGLGRGDFPWGRLILSVQAAGVVFSCAHKQVYIRSSNPPPRFGGVFDSGTLRVGKHLGWVSHVPKSEPRPCHRPPPR